MMNRRLFHAGGTCNDTSRAHFPVDLPAHASDTVLNWRHPQPPRCHSQAAVVAQQGRPGRSGAALVPQPTGGRYVSRFAVSGRMDSRKNGPRNSFHAGKPCAVRPSAQFVCGRPILPALRNHRIDYAPPTVWRRCDDLRRRLLLGRVPAGGRDHPIPQGAIGDGRSHLRRRRRIGQTPQG